MMSIFLGHPVLFHQYWALAHCPAEREKGLLQTVAIKLEFSIMSLYAVRLRFTSTGTKGRKLNHEKQPRLLFYLHKILQLVLCTHFPAFASPSGGMVWLTAGQNALCTVNFTLLQLMLANAHGDLKLVRCCLTAVVIQSMQLLILVLVLKLLVDAIFNFTLSVAVEARQLLHALCTWRFTQQHLQLTRAAQTRQKFHKLTCWKVGTH